MSVDFNLVDYNSDALRKFTPQVTNFGKFTKIESTCGKQGINYFILFSHSLSLK